MDLNNLTHAERQELFDKTGDNSNSLIAQQLLEMKVSGGYGKRLTAVADTYSSSTNKMIFPASGGVHYISIYSDSDVDFVFNAEDDTDAANKLNDPDNHDYVHFIASSERLNFGVPEMPVARIDFKAHSGTAKVYVTAFIKATSFNEGKY